jgi:nicotinate-nucleotide adenylyltransferase
MADEAFKALSLDKLWWIVAPHNPLKDLRTLAPFNDRLEMVRRILPAHSKMEASDLEHRLQSSITLNTVRHIRKNHPDDVLFLLMGMDNWETLHLWGNDYAEIFNYVSIAIFNRPGYDGFDTAPATKQFKDKRVESISTMKKSGTWYLLDNTRMNVAATTIRKLLSQGQIPEAVDPAVLDYIRQKSLYTSA